MMHFANPVLKELRDARHEYDSAQSYDVWLDNVKKTTILAINKTAALHRAISLYGIECDVYPKGETPGD